MRPVVGLKVPYAAALATGKLPRVLLGEWTMLGKLRVVPDTVDEFTGFLIAWDPIAGTFPGAEPYAASGTAHVRTVTLPSSYSHIGLPRTLDLAANPVTRAWIDAYAPGSTVTMPEDDPGIDTTNLLHAADIWYSREEALVPRGAAARALAASRQWDVARIANSATMKGKLNLFQATMLRWRDLHPYNAVHVVRIDVPLDGARLRADIEQELARQRLTGFVLDVARRRYEYAGGAAHVDLRRVAAGSDPRATTQAEIERELNAPFQREGRIEPFRFFAVDTGASFHLGLAYDHVVAGGDSIVMLLKRIVDRHCGNEAAPAEPPERYPPTYGRLFRRQAGFALRGLSSLRGTAASLRKSVRPRFPGGRDPRNAVALFRVDAHDFARFGGTAKAWGVTRNDLLIAILLAALSPFVGEARRGQRRHEIAVASIVNVRKDLLPNNDATFGQFLSSFRFSHPVPVGIPLRQLAQDIHAETERIKRGKLYLQTLLVIAIGGVLVAVPVAGTPRRLPCEKLSGVGRNHAARRQCAVAPGRRECALSGVLESRSYGPARTAGRGRHDRRRGSRARSFFSPRGVQPRGHR